MYLLSYMWSYLALITLWCKCFHSSLVDEETKGQRGKKKKKKKLPKLSNPGLLNLTVILLQHTIDSSLVPELTSPNRLCLVYVVKANLWSDLAWKEGILFFFSPFTIISVECYDLLILLLAWRSDALIKSRLPFPHHIFQGLGEVQDKYFGRTSIPHKLHILR